MDLFDVLNLIGGLCLFLLGMNLMGDHLEKFAGSGLRALLTKITNNPVKGFLVGLIVTSIIQSSSATTVMVVGFVGAGMMTLRQSVNVILGANVGTTITAWLVAMDDIGGAGVFIKLLKPSSFCPILALIGIVFVMMSKSRRKKDLGMIFLGFTVLMFGMDAMSGSVEGLREMPEFQSVLTAFSNPIMGILIGTAFTAIIQSSSASVGILQALSATGAITFSVAFPIILGQHIGTCITAMLSTLGASRDAKRTGWVHLYFNILNTVLIAIAFYAVHAFAAFGFYDMVLDKIGIAVVHTVTNLVGTLIFLPMGKLLEKMAVMTVREKQDEDEFRLLDDHLLSSPAIALAQCEETVRGMATLSVAIMNDAIGLLDNYNGDVAKRIEEAEGKADRYEDRTGSYLIKLAAGELSEDESAEAAKLQRVIGDFERISDHAVNVMESAQELKEKNLKFSEYAIRELAVMKAAVTEIMSLSEKAFCENDLEAAVRVEPLEQVIDDIRERIRLNHTLRLQKSECTIEHGFVLSDILTNLERVSDHCSNIAGCVLETNKDELDMHRYLASVRTESQEYRALLAQYREKYSL